MILYPTETLYALGVNALDPTELSKMYELKERGAQKPASWLVRSFDDIKRYGELTEVAVKIAQAFLPGSLTLVLKAKRELSNDVVAPDRTAAFRISRDPIAQKLITEFMDEFDAPLTCTSANVSGAPTLPTPSEILQQFGMKANMITRVIDDGPRKSLASTIVRCVGSGFTMLREGDISEYDILKVLK